MSQHALHKAQYLIWKKREKIGYQIYNNNNVFMKAVDMLSGYIPTDWFLIFSGDINNMQ